MIINMMKDGYINNIDIIKKKWIKNKFIKLDLLYNLIRFKKNIKDTIIKTPNMAV